MIGRHVVFRALGLLGAVLLLWATASQYQSHQQAREELADLLAEARSPRHLATRGAPALEREPDLVAARLAIARRVLAHSLDVEWIAELPPEEAAQAVAGLEEQLQRARAQAALALERRPASWEAAMVLGGTALLRRWREGSLHRYRDDWEAPLLRASVLAPAQREPRGMLAGGRLAIWHALDETERAATRGLLEIAFQEDPILRQLLPLWVATASDHDELVSVLPASPLPWNLLEGHHARRGEWQDACFARDQWRIHHLARLAEQLDEAERRLAGGDLVGGRNLLLQVAAESPPSRQAAPLFARALLRLPAGMVSPSRQRALRSWLEWALPLWMMDQPSLPPETFRRLGGLVGALPTETTALIALAGDELARAERLERRSERQWSAEWAPFLVAKAGVLERRGEREAAVEALRQVHRSAHRLWAYRRLVDELGAAATDGVASGESASDLRALSWHGSQWKLGEGWHHLEIVPAHPAAELVIAFSGVSTRGGAVEVSWNGVLQGCFAVFPDRGARLALDLETTPGLLQVRTVTGGRLRPARVELAQQP